MFRVDRWRKNSFVNAEFMGLWNATGILARMMETH